MCLQTQLCAAAGARWANIDHAHPSSNTGFHVDTEIPCTQMGSWCLSWPSVWGSCEKIFAWVNSEGVSSKPHQAHAICIHLSWDYEGWIQPGTQKPVFIRGGITAGRICSTVLINTLHICAQFRLGPNLWLPSARANDWSLELEKAGQLSAETRQKI